MNVEPDPLSRRNGSHSPEPSLGELIRQLAGQVGHLLRAEVALARTELSQSAEHISEASGKMAMGAAIAVPGVTVLLGGAVIALAELVPLWLAALIVGGVALAVGLLLISAGRNHLKGSKLAPERTIRTVRETLTGEAMQ